MTAFHGIGEAWSETGTEGILWCLLKDTKESDHPWSYDNLVILENGDELTIFDKESPSLKIWEGVVDLETESHQQSNGLGFTGQAVFNMWAHGLQRVVPPWTQEAFHLLFFRHYPMSLRRQ